MNYFSYLDDTGYDLAIDLPDDCVDDIFRPGPADEAVDYWFTELNFDADPVKTKDYLKGFGTWDDSELSDHETNLKRLLWLVACDIGENKIIEKRSKEK